MMTAAPDLEEKAKDVSKEKRNPKGEWTSGAEQVNAKYGYKITHGVNFRGEPTIILTDPKTGVWPSEVETKKNSPLEEVPHIRRIRLADKIEKVKLKNGEVKEKHVPQYKFVHSETGKEVTQEDKLAEYRKLAPPAVSNVRINLDPKAAMLSTWLDSKDRVQYRYAKKSSQAGAAEKFQRLKDFNKVLPKLRKQVAEDMQGDDPKKAELATIVYMIDKTGFRLGGTYSAKDQKYGASTLLNKHVKIDDEKITFSFVGKHGVQQKKTLKDPLLANALAKRKTSHWSDRLFDVTPAAVRNYIKSIAGQAYMTRDFRTWNGTNVALKELKKYKGVASSQAEFNRWQKEVGQKVAAHLGNTAPVAINNYIDPHVWQKIRSPKMGPFVPKPLRDEE